MKPIALINQSITATACSVRAYRVDRLLHHSRRLFETSEAFESGAFKLRRSSPSQPVSKVNASIRSAYSQRIGLQSLRKPSKPKATVVSSLLLDRSLLQSTFEAFDSAIDANYSQRLKRTSLSSQSIAPLQSASIYRAYI